MAWVCYSCGTKNPNSLDTCKSCGGNTAAPSSFYFHWVFGGMVIFFLMYLIGTFVGGTLIEVMVSPTDEQVVAEAAAQGHKVKSAMELEPDQASAAKTAVVARGKEAMSSAVYGAVLWALPLLLFLVGGIIMGFMSDGKTIVEAGIGATLGQVGGFMLQKKVFGNDYGWLALIIGVVIGICLAIVGAWLGEILQERRERAGA